MVVVCPKHGGSGYLEPLINNRIYDSFLITHFYPEVVIVRCSKTPV